MQVHEFLAEVRRQSETFSLGRKLAVVLRKYPQFMYQTQILLTERDPYDTVFTEEDLTAWMVANVTVDPQDQMVIRATPIEIEAD